MAGKGVRLNSNLRQELQKFKKLVQNQNLGKTKFILFGSWAKGNARNESDIDICVLSNKFGRDMFEEELKLKRLADQVNYLLEPIPMRPEDLKDKYSTMAYEVKKWGIVI